MNELKPCPKCGPDGVPLRRIGEMDEYRVECIECYTVQTPWFKTPGEAEAYWNAFAEGMKQQEARIAELEKRAEARKLANRVLKHKQKELKAKLNQWRKVLKEIAESDNGVDEDGFSCFFCDHMIYIAQKALKGAGDE